MGFFLLSHFLQIEKLPTGEIIVITHVDYYSKTDNESFNCSFFPVKDNRRVHELGLT